MDNANALPHAHREQTQKSGHLIDVLRKPANYIRYRQPASAGLIGRRTGTSAWATNQAVLAKLVALPRASGHRPERLAEEITCTNCTLPRASRRTAAQLAPRQQLHTFRRNLGQIPSLADTASLIRGAGKLLPHGRWSSDRMYSSSSNDDAVAAPIARAASASWLRSSLPVIAARTASAPTDQVRVGDRLQGREGARRRARAIHRRVPTIKRAHYRCQPRRLLDATMGFLAAT